MLEEKRQELGNELKDNFNIVFTNLVKEKCGNDLKKKRKDVRQRDKRKDAYVVASDSL